MLYNWHRLQEYRKSGTIDEIIARALTLEQLALLLIREKEKPENKYVMWVAAYLPMK